MKYNNQWLKTITAKAFACGLMAMALGACSELEDKDHYGDSTTAIDNAVVETPAIKTIENGQLVILRDGVKYNAMGVRLQ